MKIINRIDYYNVRIDEINRIFNTSKYFQAIQRYSYQAQVLFRVRVVCKNL